MTITVGVLTPHTTPGAEIELTGQVRVALSRGPDFEQAAEKLPAVDALAIASTGTGYTLGYDEECALVTRLQQRWNVPTTSTSTAAVETLRSRNVERISLIHPPWFESGLNELGAEYFRTQGFDVVQARLADVPNEFQPAMVVDWVTHHLNPSAEAVFLGGNGFRTTTCIPALEQSTGRHVLTANQVLLRSICHT